MANIETHCGNKCVKARDPETLTWLSPSLPSPNHPCSPLPPGASSHPVALFLQDTETFSQPRGVTFLVSISLLSLRASFSAISESSEVASLPPLPLAWRTLLPPLPSSSCLPLYKFLPPEECLPGFPPEPFRAFIYSSNKYLPRV